MCKAFVGLTHDEDCEPLSLPRRGRDGDDHGLHADFLAQKDLEEATKQVISAEFCGRWCLMKTVTFHHLCSDDLGVSEQVSGSPSTANPGS